jgi:hypothetical protein
MSDDDGDDPVSDEEEEDEDGDSLTPVGIWRWVSVSD